MNDESPDGPDGGRQRAKAVIAIYLVSAAMITIGFVIEGCF